MRGQGFSFIMQDLEELADKHDVTFVGLFHGNYPFGPIYVIAEPHPSHLQMSEFASSVQERMAGTGVIAKVAWA